MWPSFSSCTTSTKSTNHKMIWQCTWFGCRKTTSDSVSKFWHSENICNGINLFVESYVAIGKVISAWPMYCLGSHSFQCSPLHAWIMKSMFGSLFYLLQSQTGNSKAATDSGVDLKSLSKNCFSGWGEWSEVQAGEGRRGLVGNKWAGGSVTGRQSGRQPLAKLHNSVKGSVP